MLTLQTKNKITLTLETDQIVQTTFYFPLPPTFSRLQDHQIPDLWLCDHRTQLQAKNQPSLQRIFHVWGMRKMPSERGDAGSLLGPVTLLFPSHKFPFSLPEGLALFPPHSSYILGLKPRREDLPQLGGLPSPAHPGGPSLGPCQETEMSSGAGLSTCLAELTPTHRPTFHPSVTG